MKRTLVAIVLAVLVVLGLAGAVAASTDGHAIGHIGGGRVSDSVSAIGKLGGG